MSLYLKHEWEEQMVGNKVTVGPLEVFWRLHPDLNFDVALGGLVMLLNGLGQVRDYAMELPGELSQDFLYAVNGEDPSQAIEEDE